MATIYINNGLKDLKTFKHKFFVHINYKYAYSLAREEKPLLLNFFTMMMNSVSSIEYGHNKDKTKFIIKMKYNFHNDISQTKKITKEDIINLEGIDEELHEKVVNDRLQCIFCDKLQEFIDDDKYPWINNMVDMVYNTIYIYKNIMDSSIILKESNLKYKMEAIKENPVRLEDLKTVENPNYGNKILIKTKEINLKYLSYYPLTLIFESNIINEVELKSYEMPYQYECLKHKSKRELIFKNKKWKIYKNTGNYIFDLGIKWSNCLRWTYRGEGDVFYEFYKNKKKKVLWSLKGNDYYGPCNNLIEEGYLIEIKDILNNMELEKGHDLIKLKDKIELRLNPHYIRLENDNYYIGFGVGGYTGTLPPTSVEGNWIQYEQARVQLGTLNNEDQETRDELRGYIINFEKPKKKKKENTWLKDKIQKLKGKIRRKK